MTPMPPSCAIAMAIGASVTVSIAEDTSGMCSVIVAGQPGLGRDAGGQHLGIVRHDEHVVESERLLDCDRLGVRRGEWSSPSVVGRHGREPFGRSPRRPGTLACRHKRQRSMASLAQTSLASRWRSAAGPSASVGAVAGPMAARELDPSGDRAGRSSCDAACRSAGFECWPVAALPGRGRAAEVTFTAVGPPAVYHPVGHSDRSGRHHAWHVAQGGGGGVVRRTTARCR